MVMKWARKLRIRDWLHRHPLLNLQGLPEIVAASGISVRLWRAYAQAWLVCLLFPTLFLIQTPLTAGRLLLALAGLVVFTTSYTWFMWPHPLSHKSHQKTKRRASLLLLAGLTALVLILSLVYGSSFLWLFVGVSAMVGIALPAGQAFIIVVALTLLTLGVSVGISGGIAESDWFHIVPLALLIRGLGVDMIGVVHLADVLRELHETQEELAQQAIVAERLRLARDLHDLLGRTLSMITLKSELAGRLIEKDPTRAAQEVQEVERAARQALREVRTAVAGYRQPTLSSELDGARQILEAAGIDSVVEQGTGALPPAIEAALAWSVREGVTNVVHHSRAQRCTIRIGREGGCVYAEVINDDYRRDQSPAKMGSGLSGLTERVATQGGKISVGPMSTENGQCFRLRVELPIEPDLRAEKREWS